MQRIEIPNWVYREAVRAACVRLHWSGKHVESSRICTAGKLISSCVRYSCGSTSCLRHVLVRLARIAAVRPPRELPRTKSFFDLIRRASSRARWHCCRLRPHRRNRTHSVLAIGQGRNSPPQPWAAWAAVALSIEGAFRADGPALAPIAQGANEASQRRKRRSLASFSTVYTRNERNRSSETRQGLVNHHVHVWSRILCPTPALPKKLSDG